MKTHIGTEIIKIWMKINKIECRKTTVNEIKKQFLKKDQKGDKPLAWQREKIKITKLTNESDIATEIRKL